MEPIFGKHDVPTVFFISKSDDKNRVDYGLRLDEAGVPKGDKPLFPYWREFENAPPERTHPLKFFEHVPYGIAEQRLVRATGAGGVLQVRLKPFERMITITSERGPDGRCRAVARALVGGVPDAELLYAHVQLGLPMKVKHVDIHGRHPATGEPLTERVFP